MLSPFCSVFEKHFVFFLFLLLASCIPTSGKSCGGTQHVINGTCQLCPNNYFWNDRNKNCSKCPDGLSNPNGTLANCIGPSDRDEVVKRTTTKTSFEKSTTSPVTIPSSVEPPTTRNTSAESAVPRNTSHVTHQVQAKPGKTSPTPPTSSNSQQQNTTETQAGSTTKLPTWAIVVIAVAVAAAGAVAAGVCCYICYIKKLCCFRPRTSSGRPDPTDAESGNESPDAIPLQNQSNEESNHANEDQLLLQNNDESLDLHSTQNGSANRESNNGEIQNGFATPPV